MNGLSLHKKLEQNSALLIFGILFVSAIGGLVQVLPSIYQESLRTPAENTRPYTAVELAGRDIYMREGCSTCHSQQIRSLVAEVERYGPYSRAGEFVYNRTAYGFSLPKSRANFRSSRGPRVSTSSTRPSRSSSR